jgi:hypothetical protein
MANSLTERTEVFLRDMRSIYFLIISSRPAWTTQKDPVSKSKKVKPNKKIIPFSGTNVG